LTACTHRPQLEVPPVQLGYHHDGGRPATISLHVTLQPRLAPPPPLVNELRCGEQEVLARHAAKWVQVSHPGARLLTRTHAPRARQLPQPQGKQRRQLLPIRGSARSAHVPLHPRAPATAPQALQELPQCRGRAVRAMAADAQGVACLITRYVAPVSELPPGLAAAVPSATGLVTDREAAMLRLARFVSLVPFIDDAWVAGRGWLGFPTWLQRHPQRCHLAAAFVTNAAGCSFAGSWQLAAGSWPLLAC
jgi:hypothetical protein